MFSAYCETSVARASAKVAPKPATITRIPTPSVRMAAAALPKTRSSRMKASGRETSSARCRSRFSVSSMSPFNGMFPVASTSNAFVRTSARSSGKNPSASVVVPLTVTFARARFPSFDRSPAADAAGALSGVTMDTTRESARSGASAAFIPSMNRGSAAGRPSVLVKIRTNDDVAAVGAPATGGNSSRMSWLARPASVSRNWTFRSWPPARREAIETPRVSRDTTRTTHFRR